MDLDTQIITVFCRIDDALKRLLRGKRLRRSGPQPALSDAEVLTIEAVGEFLGLSQDLALYRYFRQHYGVHYGRGQSGGDQRTCVPLPRSSAQPKPGHCYGKPGTG